MTKPNFYILGAAKSGSTSLWHYLNGHPDIFMSTPKEPNFMVFENKKLPPLTGPCDEAYLLDNIYNNTIVDIESYKGLFENTGNTAIVGEASVRYLYFEQAVKNIKKYTPNAKFVLILRNPVDRLYSHYCMMRRYALETLPLKEALEEEENRIAMNWGWDWHYKGVSKYGEQLERYFKKFDKTQFKIIFYEDFNNNTINTLKEIYGFLGIPSDFEPKMVRSSNVGFLPKSYILHFWLKQEKNKNLLKKVLPGKLFYKSMQIVESVNRRSIPPLSNKVRNNISPCFKEDILKLEDLLQKRTPWLSKV